MIKNSLREFYRNIYRDRSYSLINVGGLAVGIGCAIVLGLYLQSELNYDRHFTDHERVFRIANEVNSNGNANLFAQTSYALGPLIAGIAPDVESYVRFFNPGSAYSLFRHEDTVFRWENIYFADEAVFQLFSHDIVHGNSESALSNPNSLAVSESFANRYFGEDNPVGRIMQGDTASYEITLVFSDLPDNTHLKYDALFSYNSLSPNRVSPVLNERVSHDLWNSRTDYTYVQLPENYQASDFREVSKDFFRQYMSTYKESFNSASEFILEPLDEIHLKSKAQRDLPRGSMANVFSFIGIVLFVLMAACINYINLSTARFTKRAQGVAVRKILGAERHQLIFQFLVESILFSLLASILAVAMVDFIFRFTAINTLFDKSLILTPLLQPEAAGLLLLGSVALGFIAGLYPAFSLSRSAPVKSVKSANFTMRQRLVFLQFLLSMSVISCTLLMYMQMEYIQKKPLGFDKENKLTMVVHGADNIERIPTFANELQRNSNIINVSASRNRIGDIVGFGQAEIESRLGAFESQSYNWFYSDENYLKTMGVALTEGRYFDSARQSDTSSAVMVNQSLVNKMGWDEPIGKLIRYDQGFVEVIGVMGDFHFQGLQHEVESMIVWPSPPDSFADMSESARARQNRILTISISPDATAEALNHIRALWQEFDPSHPFEFQFLDDMLDELYVSDQKQMRLIALFATICIFISCLGLFGLTAFTIEQRTKEIGMRKILGATVSQIILMLFGSVLRIVCFSAVFASITSYWIMSEWLKGYYYHEDINPLVFLVAALLSIAVAFLSMIAQSYKTVSRNPILALRYE